MELGAVAEVILFRGTGRRGRVRLHKNRHQASLSKAGPAMPHFLSFQNLPKQHHQLVTKY